MAASNVAQSSEPWGGDITSNPLHTAAQVAQISRHESILSALYRSNATEALVARGGHFLPGYVQPYPLSSPYLYSYATAFGPSLPTGGHHVLHPAMGSGLPKGASGDTYSPSKGAAHYPVSISQSPALVPPQHQPQHASYGQSEHAVQSPLPPQSICVEGSSQSAATVPKTQSQTKRHIAADEAWSAHKDAVATKRHRQSASDSGCCLPTPTVSQKPSPDLPPASAHTQGSLPHRAVYFRKGSVIQLADDRLKRVEDLTTDDFVECASSSTNLKLDSSTVAKIVEDPNKGTALLSFCVGESRVQVEVEALLEHPFFVFNRGWASACPERTMRYYHLPCHRLAVGDRFISLTHKEQPASSPAASSSGPFSHGSSVSRRQSLSAGNQSQPEPSVDSKASSASRAASSLSPE